MGWERNNFGRIVHFFYAFLLAYPIRKLFFRVADAKGFWGYFLPLDLTMSTSMLFERSAAEFFDGDLGVAYLRTQGDVWDADKDMGLASMGAFLAMMITFFLNLYLRKDFSIVFTNGLSIKHPEPLGEDELVRLWKRRKNADDGFV